MTAALYRFTQWLAAPGAKSYVLNLVRKARPGRCLDVGCGPDPWLARAGRAAVGIDLSPAFATAYRVQGGPAVVADAAALPFADGAFDSVWSIGLLHHLSDEQARTALREMRRVTRPGGETVVLDAVWPTAPWRRPIAWLIRRLDRGEWMRGQDGLLAILGGAWRCERVTYAGTGLEALVCRAEDLNAGG